jgi:chorismate mutase
VAVRAIRGATQVSVDERDVILAATEELVTEVIRANGLVHDDLISILFTATADLASVAPAQAARRLGLTDVALLCAQEMAVPGTMPRVVRLMAHVETDRTNADIRNIYLNGTEALRGEPLG